MMTPEQIKLVARQIAATGRHAIAAFTVAASDGSRGCLIQGVSRVSAKDYAAIIEACRGQRIEVEDPLEKARNKARRAADMH